MGRVTTRRRPARDLVLAGLARRALIRAFGLLDARYQDDDPGEGSAGGGQDRRPAT